MAAVSGKQVPLIKLRIQGGGQQGQFRQDQILQAQRIHADELRLADPLQAAQVCMELAQPFLDPFGFKLGGNGLKLLPGKEQRQVLGRMHGKARDQLTHGIGADLGKEPAFLHLLFKKDPAFHQGILIIAVDRKVHRDLIVDGMVVENLQGIGDNPLAGRQGTGQVRVQLKARFADHGAADDQENNKEEQAIIDHLFTTMSRPRDQAPEKQPGAGQEKTVYGSDTFRSSSG